MIAFDDLANHHETLTWTGSRADSFSNRTIPWLASDEMPAESDRSGRRAPRHVNLASIYAAPPPLGDQSSSLTGSIVSVSSLMPSSRNILR